MRKGVGIEGFLDRLLYDLPWFSPNLLLFLSLLPTLQGRVALPATVGVEGCYRWQPASRAAAGGSRRRGPLPDAAGIEGRCRTQPASRAATGGSRHRGPLLATSGVVTGNS